MIPWHCCDCRRRRSCPCHHRTSRCSICSFRPADFQVTRPVCCHHSIGIHPLLHILQRVPVVDRHPSGLPITNSQLLPSLSRLVRVQSHLSMSASRLLQHLALS